MYLNSKAVYINDINIWIASRGSNNQSLSPGKLNSNYTKTQKLNSDPINLSLDDNNDFMLYSPKSNIKLSSVAETESKSSSDYTE